MPMTADQLAFARMQINDPGSSAVQSILLSNVIGGTWTITFNGQTTAAIAWNAQAGDVQNALSALIGTGNVAVNGVGALQPYSIYFTGTLAGLAQNVVTVNTSGLLGIGGGPTATVTQLAMGGVYAFSDADLNLNFSMANTSLFLAIMYTFEALLGDLSRLNDYVAGQSQEKKSQVYDQVRQQAEHWQQWINSSQQVQSSRLESVPPRVRAYPWQPGNPALGLSYRPPFSRWRGRGPWGGW